MIYGNDESLFVEFISQASQQYDFHTFDEVRKKIKVLTWPGEEEKVDR